MRARLEMMVSAVLFGASSLAGCASTGYEKQAANVKTMEEVRKGAEEGKGQINAVTAAINDVVATANQDPVPAYKKFTSELGKLDSMAKSVNANSQDMRARADEYFKNWEEQTKTVQSAELARRSEERRALARTKFNEILEAGKGLKASYDKYFTDATDIKKYLDVNLNPAGIVSVKDIIEKLKTDGQAVQQGIDGYVAKLNELRSTMVAGGTGG